MNGTIAIVIGFVIAAGWFLSANVRVAIKTLIGLLVVVAVALLISAATGYGSPL